MSNEKRVSDLQPKKFDVAKWYKTAEILGKDFRLLEIQELQGKKGTYLAMLCEMVDGGERFGQNCGGQVVIRKIKQAMQTNSLPLVMKIIAVKNYYDVA